MSDSRSPVLLQIVLIRDLDVLALYVKADDAAKKVGAIFNGLQIYTLGIGTVTNSISVSLDVSLVDKFMSEFVQSARLEKPDYRLQITPIQQKGVSRGTYG